MSNIIHLDQYRPHITTSSRARSLVERINGETFGQVRKCQQFNEGDRVKIMPYGSEGVIVQDPEGVAGPGEAPVAIAVNGQPAGVYGIPVRHLVKLYSRGEIA